MVDLYSIGGFFYEPSFFPGINNFGGHFFKGSRSKDDLVGHLVDSYGVSEIFGSMSEGRLEFLKTYKDKKDWSSFEYNFELINGVWLGTFSGAQKPNSEGVAVCKTPLIIDNLNGCESMASLVERMTSDVLVSQ